VLALTGERVGRARKVHCPLHPDRTPSLHVYEDPARGWFCFGCRRGGSVYDLAGALWGIEPRGAGMRALRTGLQALCCRSG
jgi:DNA primase